MSLIKFRHLWALTNRFIIPAQCVQYSSQLYNPTITNIYKARTVISSSASTKHWNSYLLKGLLTCSQANSVVSWTGNKVTGQDLGESSEATQPHCLYICFCRVGKLKMSLLLYPLAGTPRSYFACKRPEVQVTLSIHDSVSIHNTASHSIQLYPCCSELRKTHFIPFSYKYYL